MRLIEANFSNLSRTIGNLFLPIITKVLPYINALVIALQRLFTWIGSIFGIQNKLKDITAGIGSSSYDFSGLEDEIGDVSDAIGGATSKAKEFNKQLRGWDELNNLTTNDPQKSSGTGGSAGGIDSSLLDAAFDDAFEEYQKVWDEAFNNLENRAQEIADKIEAIFKDLFQPISDAWNSVIGYVTVGDYAIASWKVALEEIGNLIKNIGEDFLSVWHEEETTTILKNIFLIIADIGLAIGNLAENFRNAWSENETGFHILENLRDIVGTVTENILHAADATVEWSENLDFSSLLTNIQGWTESLVPVFDSLSGIVTDFYEKVLLPLGSWTIEKGLPDLLQVFTDFNNKVDWESLRQSLAEFWEHLEPFTETIGEGLIIFIERISELLANFVNSDAFDNFLKSIENWMDNVDAEGVANALEGIAIAILAFKGVSVVTSGITGIGNAFLSLKGAVEGLKLLPTVLSGLSSSFLSFTGTTAVIAAVVAILVDLWNTSESFRTTVVNAFEKVRESLVNAFEKITTVIKPLFEALKDLYESSGIKYIAGIFADLAASLAGSVLATAIDAIATAFSGLAKIVGGAAEALSGAFDILYGFLSRDYDKIFQGFDKIGKGIADALFGAVEVVFGIGVDIVNGLFNGILDAISDVGRFIKEHVVDPILNSVKDPFRIHSPSIVMEEIGGYIMQGLLNGISEMVDSVIQKFTDIKDKIVGAWEEAKQKTEEVWGTISDKVSETWENIKTWANDKFNAAKESIGTAWDSAKEKTDTVWSEVSAKVSSTWDSIKELASNKFNAVKESIGIAWDNAKEKTSTVWNEVSNKVSGTWNDMKTWASDKFGNIKKSITDSWNDISDSTKRIWNGIKDAVKTPINAIIGFVNGMLSGIGNGVNGVIDILNKLKIEIPKTPFTDAVKIGFDISNITVPQIPELANGAVFKGGDPFLAVVNDQPMGQTNIEAPLDTIRQAFREEMYSEYTNSFDSDNNGVADLLNETIRQNQLLEQQNQLLNAILKKPNLSNNDIFKATQKEWTREAGRTQRNPVPIY